MAASRALRYGAAAATAVVLSQPVLLSHNDDTGARTRRRPIGSLLRAYGVYTVCSFPTLVDASPALLSTLGSIPGVSSLTNAVVRNTFYAQVCALAHG